METEEDLRFMYGANKKGGNITLWCDGCFPSSTTGPGTKRKREVETATRRQDKEDEVEKIVMELSKKHPEIEKTKIRLWARMISGGLHDDYEKLPDIPAFHRPLKRPRKDNNLSDALVVLQQLCVEHYLLVHHLLVRLLLVRLVVRLLLVRLVVRLLLGRLVVRLDRT